MMGLLIPVWIHYDKSTATEFREATKLCRNRCLSI